MTRDEKSLLVHQAMKLTTIGVKVECERNCLKKLVEQGVPYTDPKMLAALARFEQVDAEWKRLEVKHLVLKAKFEKRDSRRDLPSDSESTRIKY